MAPHTGPVAALPVALLVGVVAWLAALVIRLVLDAAVGLGVCAFGVPGV